MLKYLRLPEQYTQVLRELPDTTENPYYWRERRRNARRGEPYRGLLNATIMLAIIFGATWGGLWLFLTLGAFHDDRIPAWLGGQDGGRTILGVVAAVHASIVFFTARNPAGRVLAGEARSSTSNELTLMRHFAGRIPVGCHLFARLPLRFDGRIISG